MIGCMFEAELDGKLSAPEKQKILDQVKKTQGVFSASFAKAARKNVIFVHAGTGSVMNDVRKIPGVAKVKADPLMRR